MKHIFLGLIFCIFFAQVQTSKRESMREHDEYVGPVKSVFVWWSPVSGSDYPAGSRCRTRKSLYDLDGRLMQQSLYAGSCGNDEILEDYNYAADGSRTSKSEYILGKGSPPRPSPMAAPSPTEPGETRTMFKYDSLGRIIETAFVKPSDKVNYKNTHTYDAKGRIVESIGTDSEGQVSVRRVYTYAEDSRVPCTFAYYGRDGKLYERATYSDYEFNALGDWVKRREMREQTFNRRSVSITFREIEYYPEKK